jgi:transposase-like protein
MMAPFHAEGPSLVGLGEVVMILELHRQGVSVSAIARQVGLDRKTVHKYIERGLEPPAYGPRPPRASKVTPFSRYLGERLAAFPQLTGRRLHRELRELGVSVAAGPHGIGSHDHDLLPSWRRKRVHSRMLISQRALIRAVIRALALHRLS